MSAKSRQLTAGEWFGRGDQFWAAARLVANEDIGLVLPHVVCRAFAAEAYLKCLLTLRLKGFPGDHDLHRLFHILPLDDRQIIEDLWNFTTLPTVESSRSNAPSHLAIPRTLNQALKQSANAFKEWRYKADGVRYWMLGLFPLNVRDTIFTVQPEWQEAPPDTFGVQRQIPVSENLNNSDSEAPLP